MKVCFSIKHFILPLSVLAAHFFLLLGACDLITDGFFDAGQLHPGAKLLTLEEHCAMDLNQRRPIILVNAQPEYVCLHERNMKPNETQFTYIKYMVMCRTVSTTVMSI